MIYKYCENLLNLIVLRQSLLTLFIVILSPNINEARDIKIPAGYKLIYLQEYKVIINENALVHSETELAISILDIKLREINTILNPQILKELKQVPIWIEWNLLQDGSMWYHNSERWLAINGYLKAKAKGIEISNVKNFIEWQKLYQPYMVLHEFAHAYYSKMSFLKRLKISRTFKKVAASKIYENVRFKSGGVGKAYALASESEYFAELTEAYFGENDYFPFTRQQLRDFDPIGYSLTEKLWYALNRNP